MGAKSAPRCPDFPHKRVYKTAKAAHHAAACANEYFQFNGEGPEDLLFAYPCLRLKGCHWHIGRRKTGCTYNDSGIKIKEMPLPIPTPKKEKVGAEHHAEIVEEQEQAKRDRVAAHEKMVSEQQEAARLRRVASKRDGVYFGSEQRRLIDDGCPIHWEYDTGKCMVAGRSLQSR